MKWIPEAEHLAAGGKTSLIPATLLMTMLSRSLKGQSGSLNIWACLWKLAIRLPLSIMYSQAPLAMGGGNHKKQANSRCTGRTSFLRRKLAGMKKILLQSLTTLAIRQRLYHPPILQVREAWTSPDLSHCLHHTPDTIQLSATATRILLK